MPRDATFRDRTSTDGRREAIADWSRYLELSPIDLDAIRERAALFETIREPKKAAADWSRLTELEPLRMDNWLGLAKARFAAGDRTGSADALVSAARVNPKPQITRSLRHRPRPGPCLLAADNPADTQRVDEWYSLALSKAGSVAP